MSEAPSSQRAQWIEFYDANDDLTIGTLLMDGWPAGGYVGLPNGRVLMQEFAVNRQALEQAADPAKTRESWSNLARAVTMRDIDATLDVEPTGDIDPALGVVAVEMARRIVEEVCGLPIKQGDE